jgi:hypothetical protein
VSPPQEDGRQLRREVCSGLPEDILKHAMPFGEPGLEALQRVHHRVMDDLSVKHPGTRWQAVAKSPGSAALSRSPRVAPRWGNDAR